MQFRVDDVFRQPFRPETVLIGTSAVNGSAPELRLGDVVQTGTGDRLEVVSLERCFTAGDPPRPSFGVLVRLYHPEGASGKVHQGEMLTRVGCNVGGVLVVAHHEERLSPYEPPSGTRIVG